MTIHETGVQTPDWDLEQLEVILEPAAAWQLVIAGPGAGKSARADRASSIACALYQGITKMRMGVIQPHAPVVAALPDDQFLPS